MELSTTERIMMDGLQAREREIERDYIAPLRMDYTLVARTVESRLGLETGSIGARYAIDMATHTVVEVNPPSTDSPDSATPIEGDSEDVTGAQEEPVA